MSKNVGWEKFELQINYFEKMNPFLAVGSRVLNFYCTIVWCKILICQVERHLKIFLLMQKISMLSKVCFPSIAL